MRLEAEPVRPPENEWRFIDDLKSPLWKRVDLSRETPLENEASLMGGVKLDVTFPDVEGVLGTVYADLDRFLALGGIPRDGGYRIVSRQADTGPRESYRLVVEKDYCAVESGDAEGIRRGVYYLEDTLARAGGPFLPLGVVARKPFIRKRISRCFFGPINRPPKYKDELLDDVDYYPDEYLNKLAYEGVNGLWLTVTFRTIARTRFFEPDKDRERRIAKLRKTIGQCRRYGIKIYPFCIEPVAFDPKDPVLARYPELGGSRNAAKVAFCASSEIGKEYIEQSVNSLFADAPGLGGMIVLSVGEWLTLCPNMGTNANNCPRCSKRKPWEALADSLGAMERGMKTAAPDAELISWPYTQRFAWGEEACFEAAEHQPKAVALLHNFESFGKKEQLGKERSITDYWLSYIGPSEFFEKCAKNATAAGAPVFAKLQVGCSHEVASVPFVPVPGNLYRKYKEMRRLGVSGAMQCWYFGNYPGLMNKAAGELSFEPFPKSEKAFLEGLAKIYWGNSAAKAVKAWKLFSEAYDNYPLSNIFGYYGPAHDASTWPFHLKPVNALLAPNWEICHPVSGDRYGDCLVRVGEQGHSLEEILTLCSAMAAKWAEGVAVLGALRERFRDCPDRSADIGLAEALGVQLKSCLNFFRFYAARDQLAGLRREAATAFLDMARADAEAEIAGSLRLAELAETDPRLGFNSEAEGYKYFPEILRWRVNALKELLKTDFPDVAARIAAGHDPLPEYNGENGEGPFYRTRRLAGPPALDGKPTGEIWDALPEAGTEQTGIYEVGYRGAYPSATFMAAPVDGAVSWKLGVGADCFYLGARGMDMSGEFAGPSELILWVEAKRFWPKTEIRVPLDPQKEVWASGKLSSDGVTREIVRNGASWSLTAKIPFGALLVAPDENLSVFRFNLTLARPLAENPLKRLWRSWAPSRPLPYRWIFSMDNPRDFGWVRVEEPR